MAEENKTNKAWNDILAAHPEIMDTIANGGVYELPASEIKKIPGTASNDKTRHLGRRASAAEGTGN